MNEIILLLVIILQFGYIIYRDIAERKDREKLELKLMSRNLDDYKMAVEPEPEPAESKPDPYKPVEDVDTEKLLMAEDNI